MSTSQDDEFAAFYHENFRRVAGFAASLCLTREEAFDLTQEAFARTWAAWDRAREADRPVLFTMKVAANVAFSAMRRARRLRQLMPSLVSREADDHASVSDTRLVLRAAIRSLPRMERMAVVLSYLGDLPAEDVARILDVSPTTVRVHLTHARRRLGTLLGSGLEAHEKEA